MTVCPCFFHPEQLTFRPRYEWALGRRIEHPERTERADNILAALKSAPARFEIRQPEEQPIEEITAQHSIAMLELYSTAENLRMGETFYPSVFLQSPALYLDTTNIKHIGHFCFDSGTPISREVREAAFWSASCAFSAAQLLHEKSLPMTYALSRPPGHHASEALFGGYCYVNNAALAANYLKKFGRVAILDIDAHHGNGTQVLFWRDPDVLTISIHGDPVFSFPYMMGYAEEIGEDSGLGTNINIPMPPDAGGNEYMISLEERVAPAIKEFAPDYLVVAAGVDTYELDTVGQLVLSTDDFFKVGQFITSLGCPMVVIQEGGYYTPDIGENVMTLLNGMRKGAGL